MVIFQIFLLRSETAPLWSWKVDHHILNRFLPLFVTVWIGFQVRWVGTSVGWDPLIWKPIFRREDGDLVRQTGLSVNRSLWCDVRCLWTNCSSSIRLSFICRILFHVDAEIYFQYSADRLKKVKEAIQTTNNLIAILREWTDFSPYNYYINSAIQYFLDVLNEI